MSILRFIPAMSHLSTTSSFCIFLSLAILNACSPHHHSIEPYKSDQTTARLLEQHAVEVCSATPGTGDLPPNKFTTDGCSMWLDSWSEDDSWQSCCIEHDIAYWCGGSTIDRRMADQQLRECVKALGHPTMAGAMQIGTRIGGHPLVPFPWRWGYGWDWPHTPAIQ